MSAMASYNPIEFTGIVLDGKIHAVSLRGKDVGELDLDLDQWDQLREDVRKLDKPAWISAVAFETKIKATTS